MIKVLIHNGRRCFPVELTKMIISREKNKEAFVIETFYKDQNKTYGFPPFSINKKEEKRNEKSWKVFEKENKIKMNEYNLNYENIEKEYIEILESIKRFEMNIEKKEVFFYNSFVIIKAFEFEDRNLIFEMFLDEEKRPDKIIVSSQKATEQIINYFHVIDDLNIMNNFIEKLKYSNEFRIKYLLL